MRLLAVLLFTTLQLCAAEEPAFTEKRLHEIRDREVSALGAKALAIRADEWKHGESANFVLHFHDAAAAQAVASESEFYYRCIAKELERDTTRWERKGHIFIFESEEDWRDFQGAGSLEP